MFGRILFFLALTTGVLCEQSLIHRACGFNDQKCLQKVFAKRTRCNPNVRGYIPKEYNLNNVRFEIPYIGTSIVNHEFVIKNHDQCTVTEFFHDFATKTAVLTLECANMEFNSNRTVIWHKTKQEDEYFNYLKFAPYPLIQLTVNLKEADNFDICSAFTFAEVPVLPKYKLVPHDPRTSAFIKKTLQDKNFRYIYEKEVLLYAANHLFRTYFNNYICDFGCN